MSGHSPHNHHQSSKSKESVKKHGQDPAAAQKGQSETRVRMESPVCRICYMGSSAGRGVPIQACNCRAAFAFVHPKCIAEWIQATDAVRCDICQFAFVMKKRPESLRNWFRSQEKEEEYKMTMQTAGMYFFNLMIAGILFYATYGSIVLIVSFVLAGCTVFWIIFLTGSILIYGIREWRSFREWRSTHFRIDVFPNPNPDSEVASKQTVYDLGRAVGLTTKRQGSATAAPSASAVKAHPHHPHPGTSPVAVATTATRTTTPTTTTAGNKRTA